MNVSELEFSMEEVDWPAPARLTREVARSPRALALYSLRRFSRIGAKLLPRRFGNRYFFAGRYLGESHSR